MEAVASAGVCGCGIERVAEVRRGGPCVPLCQVFFGSEASYGRASMIGGGQAGVDRDGVMLLASNEQRERRGDGATGLALLFARGMRAPVRQLQQTADMGPWSQVRKADGE